MSVTINKLGLIKKYIHILYYKRRINKEKNIRINVSQRRKKARKLLSF